MTHVIEVADARLPLRSATGCYAKATLPEGTKIQEIYPQFGKGFFLPRTAM